MSLFNYDRQISSSPDVVSDLLGGADVPELDASRPIIFSGIGTSLHAARVAANWVTRLTAGRASAHAVDAHDLGADYPIERADQVIVISHRGYKIYPNKALARATEAGADTFAIVGQSAPVQTAKYTLRTCANESAGTFSVSYLASLTVLARLAATIDPDPQRRFSVSLALLPEVLRRTLDIPLPNSLIRAIAALEPLVLIGFGTDYVTVQEAALKIKEGAWMWTEAMSPEFALHGTPAAFTQKMGAVLITPQAHDGGRTETLAGVLKRIGLPVVASCGEGELADLRFVSPHPLLRPFTSILPFHRTTAELARIRKTDPDTLHGHREPWKTIMTEVKL